MARLEGLDPSRVEADLAERLRTQEQRLGRPAEGAAIMARRPTIARAYRGMFDGIAASGLLAKGLRHLVNRRVAMRVGCPY